MDDRPVAGWTCETGLHFPELPRTSHRRESSQLRRLVLRRGIVQNGAEWCVFSRALPNFTRSARLPRPLTRDRGMGCSPVMRRLSPDRIALVRPFGRLAPRRAYPLPPAKINPVIRIAHRIRGARHIHERVILDHEFVLILDGRGEIRIGDEKPREFAAHHLYLLPPFVPHVIMTEMCEHVAVHFDFAAGFPPHGRSLGRREPYEVQFTHGLALPRQIVTSPSDQIEEMFLELVRERDADEPLSELRATNVLTRILLTLLKRPTPTVDGDPHARTRVRIERAVTYASKHFAQKLSAAQLAQVSGLSLSHFNRLFHEWTGYSPIEYLRRLRVDRARQLLADVDLSIKEIALKCGFDDTYHFSKTFRQIDGLPPTKYRESLLAGR